MFGSNVELTIGTNEMLIENLTRRYRAFGIGSGIGFDFKIKLTNIVLKLDSVIPPGYIHSNFTS